MIQTKLDIQQMKIDGNYNYKTNNIPDKYFRVVIYVENL